MSISNGIPQSTAGPTLPVPERQPQASPSLLRRFDDHELHDIVCIGFGPAALAIAVALHDSIEIGDPTLRTHSPKVRFLERQPEYAWHPGMLLEESSMQITFMKDLATLRNARSRFTFLSYLQEQQRLVDFTNLGVLLPSRPEYNDYMQWCASAFEDVVDYNRTATKVEAVQGDSSSGAVQHFRVISKSTQTGKETILKGKHIIVAVGGKPFFPQALRLPHPRIIHSSQYVTRASSLSSDERPLRRVAVIGAGQSAAEIFANVPVRFPGAQAVLITRGESLRPSDDSPFVNEVFHPSRTDDVFSQDPRIRAQYIATNRSTNYGVVRLNLLEQIYSKLYSYKVKRMPEEVWPHRILNFSAVTGVQVAESDDQFTFRLDVENTSNAYRHSKVPQQQSLGADLIVVACGYDRNAYEDILQDLQPLRRAEDVGGWRVGRNYAVEFQEDALERDTGIWLQGCNEKTHGLSDSLLSVLSVRGGEIVTSILGTPDRKLKNSGHSELRCRL